MRKCIFILFVLFFCPILEANIIFSDDFEDGTLGKWTIDGRQEGNNIAEVVSQGDNEVAHLYHTGLTEITIEKIFDYSNDLTFSFEMEVQASSPFGPTDDDYAMSGVYFAFYDASGELIRTIAYVYTTSSVPFEQYNILPDSYYFYPIPEGEMFSYIFNAEDMLLQLGHDPTVADSVRFYFRVYGSGYGDQLVSDVWADNVVIIPEPGTLILMGFGVLGLLRRKRNTN